MKTFVIALVVKIVVKNELVFSHFDIRRDFLIVHVDDPGQFKQEPQLVNVFAVLYFVLPLLAADEV